MHSMHSQNEFSNIWWTDVQPEITLESEIRDALKGNNAKT